MSLAICCCSRWRCTVLRSSTVMMVDRRGPLSGPVRQTPRSGATGTGWAAGAWREAYMRTFIHYLA
jgi:hypothetical protein